MRASSRLDFVTSNRHKFEEARRILDGLGVAVGHRTVTLPEIQSDSLAEIAVHKALAAHRITGGAVLVEDDGLFVESLGGFPGPYSSYVFGTIGNRGILELARGDRAAAFRSAVAYSDGERTLHFQGMVRGSISDAPRGNGWGYDPIFVPEGAGGTFAQIDKDGFSHRRAALAAFAEWYLGDGQQPVPET